MKFRDPAEGWWLGHGIEIRGKLVMDYPFGELHVAPLDTKLVVQIPAPKKD